MLACVCGMVCLNITHSAKVLSSYPEQIMTDIYVKLILKNIQKEAEEMPQWLGAPAALPEKSGSIPSTHMVYSRM